MQTKEIMKQKNILKYNKWNDHLKNTKEISNYSIRRMDLLIISISGAGIYIIFETLREFKTGKIDIDNSSLLLFSGVLFLLGIVSNFVSQLTSYSANRNEENFTQNEISLIEGNKIDECER